MQSTPRKAIPGRVLQREARRSARTRLAPTIITPASAPADVRERHAASRHNHERDLALPDRAARRDDRTRRRRKPGSARSGSRAQDDDYGAESQRSDTSFGFRRVATGDLQEDDDDSSSDSSYNSFNLSLQKKALFRDESSADIEQPTNGATDTALLKPQPSAWKSEDRDRQVTVYRVYRSRYEGVDFQNGNLSAQLMTGTNRRMFQNEYSKPLFRWM
jgi:hypothetical protein